MPKPINLAYLAETHNPWNVRYGSLTDILWFALRYLEALPEEEQPGSDMDDMRDLLETRYRSLEHIFTEQEFRRRFEV